MRSVRVESETPGDAVRVVGVLGGEPLESVSVTSGALAALGFDGEPNKTQLVATSDGPVLLVGLGEEIDRDGLGLAAGAAGRAIPASKTAATSLHQIDVDGALEAVVVGFLSGAYRYDAYRSSDGPDLGDLVLLGHVDAGATTGPRLVAEAVGRARDWVNRPPVDKSPDVG
ncbi:MAG TPA: M17 family peptidase N-terminal domain-containing protein, partial [Acidimicrobiia bacterium]|nr:M17 family peptidase N-terminal domain-containing protein [Acidimicrobiia bacterium]